MDLIFLTGHRKSGTSMFHKLFDSHPDVTVYPVDVSLLYAYFPYYAEYKKHDSSELKLRINHVLKSALCDVVDKIPNKPNQQGIDDFLRLFWSFANNVDLTQRSDVLRALLLSWETWVGSTGKPIVIKETSQSIYFEEFSESFDSCKFLHLVRDPRDNWAAIRAGVESYYKAFGEGDWASLASLLSRARMDFLSASAYSRKDPKNFMTVRYEDLVQKTEETMTNVALFAGLKFSNILTQPSMLGASYQGNNHDGVKTQGVSTNNLGRWRERISDFEAKLIEFWMKDVMDEWGYTCEFSECDAAKAFGEYYKWYNSEYFYYDSFSKPNVNVHEHG